MKFESCLMESSDLHVASLRDLLMNYRWFVKAIVITAADLSIKRVIILLMDEIVESA